MHSCAHCGTANEDHAVYCQSCGNLVTPVASGAEGYGGFWKRVLAWFIDGMVVGAAIGLVTAVTFGFGIIVLLVAHWLYEAFMTSSAWQATVGKRALGMVVTDLDGHGISFGRATGRHFAKLISGMTLGIGFLIVAFTTRKQGLHDMIADTIVVNR